MLARVRHVGANRCLATLHVHEHVVAMLTQHLDLFLVLDQESFERERQSKPRSIEPEHEHVRLQVIDMNLAFLDIHVRTARFFGSGRTKDRTILIRMVAASRGRSVANCFAARVAELPIHAARSPNR